MKDLGGITNAVVTVPTYFNDSQHQATEGDQLGPFPVSTCSKLSTNLSLLVLILAPPTCKWLPFSSYVGSNFFLKSVLVCGETIMLRSSPMTRATTQHHICLILR